MNYCLHCGYGTLNPKFCSRGCAAVVNNRKFPKRTELLKKCAGEGCEEWLPNRVKKRKFCSKCRKPVYDWKSSTLAEIQGARKYQRSSRVRDWSKAVYAKSGRPYICQHCGYSKHVEICHIKAIHSFPPETPVAVVNDIENLIALCPNCHWEMDRNARKGS